jgi:putative protease
VALRDVHGRAHPVMADVGCRNTVFGAEAQEASHYLDKWQEAGIRHYRLEFVDEDGETLARIGHLFRQALDGQLATEELTVGLGQVAPQGTTEGSLFVPNNFMELPVL